MYETKGSTMKVLISIISIFISLPSIAAQEPYVWAKDIGNNRIERGIGATVLLQPLIGTIERLTNACADDELLVNGGCVTAYGFRLSGSIPFSSRSSLTHNTWICIGDPDLSTALTIQGNKPTPQTPQSDLTGYLEIVLTCEKKK